MRIVETKNYVSEGRIMLSDIEIARNAEMLPIEKIAEKLDIPREDLEFYGKYKAKLPLKILKERKDKKDGKLVLVTAMNDRKYRSGTGSQQIGQECDARAS